MRYTKTLIPLLLTLSLASWSGITQAKDTGYIFVSSEKDHVVTVLDGKTYETVKSIKTAERPRHLAFNQDRSLIYAACGDGDTVDIIDIAKLEVTDQISDIDDPEAFDVSPDGKMMYMSLEDDGALGFINLETKKLENEVEVGEEPEGVLTSPDGKTVFVTSEVANMVHVIDTETKTTKADIVVGKRPRRFALTPDQSELWVTSELDASISIIDLSKLEVIEKITFEPKGFRQEDITPVGIVITKDGTKAYVGMGRANRVAILDVKKRSIEDYILVGERAWNVTLNKDESLLFAVNGLSDDVSIIDTRAAKVIKSVPVGRVPYMALIDD